MDLSEALRRALDHRQPLLAELGDTTTCYRLFHGVAEGRPGLTVDRYGPHLLVQSWREPPTAEELAAIEHHLGGELPVYVWDRRKGATNEAIDDLDGEQTGLELGLRFDVRPPHAHRGQDPLMFLDFRAARRWVRANAAGASVLNLFAYTCGVGVAAAAGGASEVWNVDFAASALDVGRTNAELNGVAMELVHEDVLPVIRQLGGLAVGGRRGRQPAYRRFPARTFDLVVLDPPRWARTSWGAVDVVGDYPSLFKPAVLATAPGGAVLATHHVPTVTVDEWVGQLRRCAAKAGRPLRDVELLQPDADFPTFDGAAPLKLAVCRL